MFAYCIAISIGLICSCLFVVSKGRVIQCLTIGAGSTISVRSAARLFCEGVVFELFTWPGKVWGDAYRATLIPCDSRYQRWQVVLSMRAFIPVSITATSGGLPTGAPLATVNISPTLSATQTFYFADFSTEMINLVAGEAYAIVLGSPATGAFAWRGDSPGSYAGGNAVISFDSGARWLAYGGADRGFSVIVEADCNGDGIIDDFQVDSDGDGIIDDCDDDDDSDGLIDEFDVCPSSRSGLPVDCDGRPLRDCNNDCLVNGLDLQCIVDELLGS